MTLPQRALRCPSCGRAVLPQRDVNGKLYCQCLASFDVKTGRWAYQGRTVMAKTIKPAQRDHYVECTQCSEEEGEQVLYHTSALRKERGFFSDGEETLCPKGHEMKPEKS